MNAPLDFTAPDAPLYRALADRLVASMAAGALRPGERLPSVRALAAREQVSVATAVAAYRDLEARSRIEARPRSGFFVATRPVALDEPVVAPRPRRVPSVSGVNVLVMQILEAARNPDVVPLAAACPSPEFMLPIAQMRRGLNARLARDPGLALQYRMGAGYAPLQQAVARRLVDVGCVVEPHDVIVTNGCMEALMLALRATTRPGDTVAIESPAYFGLLQIMETLGLRALELPTHPRTGLSVEAFDLATRREGAVAAVVVTPNFSNPLGSLMPDGAKKALAALAQARGVAVIEDDIYGELPFGEHRPRVLKHWDRSGNVILCGSFSKVLTPGLRVGWMAPGRWRDVVAMHKFTTSVATSELNQALVAELLVSGGYDRHLRRLRAAFRESVARTSEAVERHFPAGTRITRPAGGFVLWIELPPDVDALALFWKALDAGVSFVPGALFAASGRFTHHLRLSAGQRFTPRIDDAIRTLGRLMR
ncbi:MAG: PLP-dependent aminotransferase family protein [Burkholderiales bacterium]|nr:PLP-dependent aminotransferase family protein [Burkholderiales bacterium]